MISVLMPYWCRDAALSRTLADFGRWYDRSIEVIVIVDGCKPPTMPANLPFEVKHVRLPPKSIAKNPCVPFNAGEREASGEYICLTNPETAHGANLLHPMLSSLSGKQN